MGDVLFLLPQRLTDMAPKPSVTERADTCLTVLPIAVSSTAQVRDYPGSC